ncbi:MAG: outer membrane protein assembly factor BamD [Proteobacteria bacterium]|nr:MAG: outer membrane protein assembly factor BamD [Pseudomonadota bacterium]PIE65294.1 MAG: outer membrane protein assembly factor BamD [Desulfobacterales bacterium]
MIIDKKDKADHQNSFLFQALSLFFLLSLLQGCASLKDLFSFGEENADTYLPAEQLIMKGMDEFNVGKYYLALEYFNEIMDRYPFSPQAPLAELKAADSNYYMERYIEASALYREFEERHPTNEAMPYVMYQKAMCSYQKIDTIDRDVTGAHEAIKGFQELLRAFPGSPYSAEAEARIKAAREFLAHHEFYVVKFYLRMKKYSEAEARLTYILSVYPDSEITSKANEILTLIQAGTPPEAGILEWFKELSLPDWSTYLPWTKEKKEQSTENR